VEDLADISEPQDIHIDKKDLYKFFFSFVDHITNRQNAFFQLNDQMENCIYGSFCSKWV